MNDIWRGFQLLVVLAVGGIVLWGAAQILPQVQSVATMPARVGELNAQSNARATAAIDFVALEVKATAQAIENEKIMAQAHANAETIAAQGDADQKRGIVEVLLTLVWSVVGVAAAVIGGVVLWRTAQAWLFARAQKHSVETAARAGGTVYLPNGHHVEFKRRDDVKNLPAPPQETVAPRERARSSKRR